ncbi:hypothetical protein WOLCODRAFT_27650 [Wolfiporia cocos MD-104 SS10]|uniref:Uncharacterized protein n=1 Tax=Wolfiporia cocos (strain MD-104) TaxID=742152 RepID=A0A2H3J5T7_WOLCO|nr:hypothetical protein WOLCODRAFT_27650 [Wolfiporia cocos MD-104 SS10]
MSSGNLLFFTDSVHRRHCNEGIGKSAWRSDARWSAICLCRWVGDCQEEAGLDVRRVQTSGTHKHETCWFLVWSVSRPYHSVCMLERAVREKLLGAGDNQISSETGAL